MLVANKTALAAQVQQGSLQIRVQELQLYLNDMTSLCTQVSAALSVCMLNLSPMLLGLRACSLSKGALFAGFAVSVLTSNLPPSPKPIALTFFFVWGTLSFVLSLYVLSHAASIVITAPSLALRSKTPTGQLDCCSFPSANPCTEVESTVLSIRGERVIAFKVALAAIVSFTVQSGSTAWVMLPTSSVRTLKRTYHIHVRIHAVWVALSGDSLYNHSVHWYLRDFPPLFKSTR
jgi:hypothetical protein